MSADEAKISKIIQLLKNWSERTGESYSKLAHRLGTCQQNVSRWANGTAFPSEKHLRALLGIIAPDEDLSFFIGGDKATEKMPVLESSRYDLPLEQLSPENFERFCRQLAELKGHDGARRLGVSGDSQEGIDIYCEKTRAVIQCKQTKVAKGYSASSVKKVIENYNGNLAKLEEVIGFKPKRKILAVTTPGVSAKGIAKLRGEKWEYYSLEELTSVVRSLPIMQKEDLVKTFFPDNPWVLKKCLGIEPAFPFVDAIKYYGADSVSRICSLDTKYVEFDNDPLKIIENKIANSGKADEKIKSRFLLLEGEMGSGKSRVLKELSSIRGRNTFIVSVGENITETALRYLIGDNVVIVDSGEDGIDILAQILNSALSIAATGPSANLPFVIVAVTPRMAERAEQLFISRGLEPPETIRMLGMSIENQKKLLRDILGGISQCENYLIEVSDGNLVYLVKTARLLKAGEKNLLGFSQDDIIKRISQKYIDDNVNSLFEQSKDKQDCRTILRIISLLEPFRNNADLFNVINNFGIEQRRAQKIIRKLKRAGVLRTFAGSTWIRPILLGDCVCNEALSEFDEEDLSKIVKLYRFDVLRNIGRLGICVDSDIVARIKISIWQTIENDFEEGDASERETVLHKVRDMSYLYPEEAMNLAEYAVSHAAKPSNGIWGETTQKDVLAAIPPISEGVYYNIGSRKRPIRLLVDLADENESRHDDSALGVLARIIKPDLKKSVSFQEEAIETIIELVEPKTAKDWVFNLFLEALSTSEIGSSWYLHMLTLEPFRVDPKKVEKLHKMILDYYFTSVQAASNAGFTPVAAAKAICRQLRVVTNDKLWGNERRYILKKLEEVLNDKNVSGLIKALFYKEINHKSQRIKKVFETIENEVDFMVYRAILDGDSRSTFGEAYGKSGYKRYIEWLERLTDLLLESYSSNLDCLFDMIEDAIIVSAPYAGRVLIETLCKKSDTFCKTLIEKSLAEEVENGGLQANLYLALDCLLVRDTNYAFAQIDRCLDTNKKMILNSVAIVLPKAIGKMAPERSDALSEKLIKKADENTVETLIFSAIRPENCDSETVKGIVKVVLQFGSPRFTYRLLPMFERRYGRIKPEELTEDEVDTIIDHLAHLNDLDYQAIDFLNSIVIRAPRKVVDVFIKRMALRETKKDYSFTVVPYKCKLVFSEADKGSMFEYLLSWLIKHNEGISAELYWVKIAKLLSVDEKIIFAKMRDVIKDGLDDKSFSILEKLICVLPVSSLWGYEGEIENVLRSAQETTYPDAVMILEGVFAGIAKSISKMRSVGAPDERDVELRDKSQVMIDESPYGHLSRGIYLDINKYAKKAIEYDRREDEEEGIRWDDKDQK